MFVIDDVLPDMHLIKEKYDILLMFRAGINLGSSKKHFVYVTQEASRSGYIVCVVPQSSLGRELYATRVSQCLICTTRSNFKNYYYKLVIINNDTHLCRK